MTMTIPSSTKEISVAAVTCWSCFLSYVGSFVIVRLASRRLLEGNTNTNNPLYQQLMIAVSLSDIGSSTGFLLGTFAVLEGHPTSPFFAVGTTVSCTLAGYLSSVFFLTSALCNAFLARYFLWTVQRRSNHASNSDKRRARIWFGLALLVPQAIGVAALCTKSYNQLDYVGVCWITKSTIDGYERGSDFSTLLRIALLGSIVLASLAAMVTTVRVWLAYKKIIQSSQRHIFTGSSTNASSSRNNSDLSLGTPTTNTTRPAMRNRNDDYFAQATTQAVWYCIVYANQFVWFTGSLVIAQFDITHTTGFYVYQLVSLFLVPLNGLLNAIVYVLPAFTSLRRKHNQQDLSRTKLLWYVLLDKSSSEIQQAVSENNRGGTQETSMAVQCGSTIEGP